MRVGTDREPHDSTNFLPVDAADRLNEEHDDA
jgi:hypothetical protein